MKRSTTAILSTVCLLLLNAPFASGQEDSTPKGAFAVGKFQNNQAGAMVRVSLLKIKNGSDVAKENSSGLFAVGDKMVVRVHSEKSGYLYLLYAMADGTVGCLFPNKFQKDNFIQGKKPVLVPKSSDDFEIQMAKPLGKELLKAVMTEKPLKDLELAKLRESAISALSEQNIKGAVIAAKQTKMWEHHVCTRVVEDEQEITRAINRPKKCHSLCIGISFYDSEAIRQLMNCANDAEAFHTYMQKFGGLSMGCGILLTNKQATLENIRAAFQKLIENSKEGDTVVIFWSGHGGRMADTSGDEKDGLDEYFVPHNGSIESPDKKQSTMFVDDELGRIMQSLDGRKILMVMDTCHSGGAHRLAKTLEVTPNGAKGINNEDTLDLFDGEINRAKDIGQDYVFLLASSKPHQLSFEMRNSPYSTMTYFLVKNLKTAANPCTIHQVFPEVEKQVSAYVKKEFPGNDQRPLLIGPQKASFVIKP